MRSILNRLRFALHPSLLTPLTLVGLLTLAYGLLLPRQGYSFDEWHFIYYSLIEGPKGLPELFHYDGHPQTTWLYLSGFRWLGYAPLAWHFLAFFWKAACVVMFWALLNRVWPKKRQQTFIVAMLFALYPFFTLQVFAIAYFEVWYSFFLLWLSIFLTIQSVQQPDRFWLWLGLALLTKIGHLFTSEYTWFLEVFRPLFIFLVLPVALPRAEKIRRTALLWLPYFALFLTAAVWRGFFYQPLRSSFRVMEGVFNEPHLVVLAALRHWVPDSALTLFTSWFYTLKPDYLDFSNRVNLFIALAALAGGALAWCGLAKLSHAESGCESDSRWAFVVLTVGAIGMVAGFLPSYVAGYTAYLSEWPGNARLALAAFPGAALMLTALLDLAARPRARWVIVALLVALLVGWHVRVNYDFQRVWEAQRAFYRQLTWRIPSLQPNTVLLLPVPYEPALAPDSPARIAVEPEFSVALAISALYEALPDQDGRVPYWFSSNLENFTPENGAGQAPPFESGHATLLFSGQPGRLISLYFDPQGGECLRVLSPEYGNYKRIPPPVKAAALLSRPENILPATQASFSLRETILGAEKRLPWCYYYEKGALAAQYEHWQEALALWEQAEQEGLRPRSGYELLPFIEAYLHENRWEQALGLTQRSSRLTPGMDAALCPLWGEALQDRTSLPEQDRVWRQVEALLGCQP